MSDSRTEGAVTRSDGGVSEGIRTPGRWSHNPELYQLSYAHLNKGDKLHGPWLTGR